MAKKPSNRSSGYGKYTPEEIEAMNLPPEVKKAYMDAAAEEKRLADEKKALAAERRKEQKRIRDAEKAAEKTQLNEINEIKKASSKSSSAAKEKQKKADKQAKDTNRLDNINRKLGGGIVGGTIKNIGGMIGSSIRESTVGNMLNPRALAGSMLAGAGLAGIVPSVIGGSRGDTSDRRRPSGGSKDPSQKLDEQVDILETISNTLTALLKVNEDSRNSLQGLIDSQTSAARARIEAAREARATNVATPAGTEVTGKTGGGLFGGLGDILGGVTTMLGPLFKGLGSIFSGILKFAKNIVGPIGILIAIVGSLEQKDWGEIFGNLAKVFDDLLKGNFLDAIIRMIGTIGDALITGAGRLVANILEGIGLDGVANSIRQFLDNFDLATTLVNATHAVIDFVVNAFNNTKETIKSWVDSAFNLGQKIIDWLVWAKDSIVGAFNYVKETVSGWINSAFNLGQLLIDWAVGLKDGIVNKFTAAKDEIIAWWDNFSLSALLTEKFEEIKNKIIAFVGEENIQKIFDVLNFDVGGYISGKLGEVVDKIKNMFSGIAESIGNFLYEKGKLFEKVGFSNPFEGLKSKSSEPAAVTAQSSFGALAAAGPSVPLTAQTSYREVPIDMGEGITSTTTEAITSFKPTVNTKNIALAAQSGWNAMATASPPPVIVMGGGTSNASREPPSAPRTSGAVQTAPAPSLFDRHLYDGAYFGAGHP